MKIVQCLHTAILVSNLEKAERFYSEVLELAKVNRSLNYPGVWYQIGDYQFHLIVHPHLHNQRHNPDKWGRNPHIAFAVDDLEEVKQRLWTEGYEFQMSSSGRAALFVQDPDGNIIELGQV